MKFGLVLTFCVAITTLSAGVIKKIQSDTVAEFRAAIDYRYTRLHAFYDATNNAMRVYRLAHVDSIHVNYQGIISEFARAIENVRSRGSATPYVKEINQNNANFIINACARSANETLGQALRVNFYPTFSEVQAETSKIPLMTLNALSRGNVFDDNEEILAYLQSQYDVKVMQWLSAVSQLFRWEKTRVDVYGRFFIEEMSLCLGGALQIEH